MLRFSAYNLLILALLMLCSAAFNASAAEALVFKAGAATSNITPPLGVSLAGSMTDHRAAHIHDELHARCVVLDDGSKRLAIVLIDNCLIPRAVLDAAKARVEADTGIPQSQQLMAATHSHSAPTVTPIFQSEPETDYIDFLVQRIADGVRRACNQLAPARIAWGTVDAPEHVHNRRWRMQPEGRINNPFGVGPETKRMNPPRASDLLIENGPIDPEIFFLALENLEGRPLALLANYSLHYIGGVGGGHVSADYAGYFANHLQTLLDADNDDPPFVAMMSNGTSGNINNIDFEKPGVKQAPYEQMRYVGHAVAQSVKDAYGKLEWRDHVALDVQNTDITLGVRKPDAEEVERAQALLKTAEGRDLKGLAEIYSRETVRLVDYPDQVTLPLQTLRLGDLAIAAIPCEVFAETGLALKSESPFPATFTIELANGYYGYLPTAEEHALGGYETWRARSSYLATDAEARVRATTQALLEKLHAR
jgi:neutral ceramidase